MNFQFGGASKLFGRKIYLPIDRFAYVPKSEEGLQEYIFAYKTRVPTPNEEPDIYRNAQVSQNNPDEVTLRYECLNEIVLLLTIASDDNFRTENSELVSKNEAFKVEETK
ncbi:hypothetical protein HY485_00040 [Candidatus Woesearchaeota archaeon]|nr:hypothetical protein [Candidatus Woesearchaeota archaeon]